MVRNVQGSRRSFVRRAYSILHANHFVDVPLTLREVRRNLIRDGAIGRRRGKLRFTPSSRLKFWSQHGFPTHWTDLPSPARSRMIRAIFFGFAKEVFQTQKGWEKRDLHEIVPEVQKKIAALMRAQEDCLIKDEVELGKSLSPSWIETLHRRIDRRGNFFSILEGVNDYLSHGPFDLH